MKDSKSLGHDDMSGFNFAKEMLSGEITAAINFDRLQKHPQKGYIIFEYLLCEEEQMKLHNTTPYKSHPNKYWNKNKRKFLALWRAALDLNATLYLVNYAKKGTKYENEVLLIDVLGMNEYGITEQEIKKFTRLQFKQWFINLNNECLGEVESIMGENKVYVRNGYYHTSTQCRFLIGKNDYSTFNDTDSEYYLKFHNCKECCPRGLR